MTIRAKVGAAAGIGVVVCAAVGWHVFSGSPPATAHLTLAGQTIEIHYSTPSVRGRRIFGDGGLVSQDRTYPVWRAGANAATTLRSTADLDIGGLAVPAGAYSLYVLVSGPHAWELIVNRETGQWGLSYDPTRDLGRIRMTMSTPPALAETLTFVLRDRGGGQGELRLEWEHHIATVPLSVR